MKNIKGTLLIACALLAHVGFIVATEDAYIFSFSDYDASAGNKAPVQELFTSNVGSTESATVLPAWKTVHRLTPDYILTEN
ncbi:MAG: hypothetical protein R2794_02790 [Chitinophagales bacterium]